MVKDVVDLRAARGMGLVCKRADRPYRAGHFPDWVKDKNSKHPAVERVMDSFKRLKFAAGAQHLSLREPT
jgi:ATP-dependent DNA ligase